MYISLLTIGLLHPFKISVCEVNYNGTNKSLEMTIKIFQDDMIYTLHQIHNKDINLNDDQTETKDFISSYITQNLKVKVDHELREATFVGYELEEDVIWIYLEYSKVSNPEMVEIEDKLLMDAFREQNNLVHFKYGEEIKSKMCTDGNTLAVFSDFKNW